MKVINRQFVVAACIAGFVSNTTLGALPNDSCASAVPVTEGAPAADYVWFTPRAEREDQCEELRKRFGK